MMKIEAAHRKALSALIASDENRLRLLRQVEALHLPDCWVGAGFVRSAVWDSLHGYAPGSSWDDVDVVWFDRDNAMPQADELIEQRLGSEEPAITWSVKNQARMHRHNDDQPYGSTEDAVFRWPETATAIAIRTGKGAIEIIAPHGLNDLFSLIVRPTPAFAGQKIGIFRERVQKKGWLARWPLLVIQDFENGGRYRD